MFKASEEYKQVAHSNDKITEHNTLTRQVTASVPVSGRTLIETSSPSPFSLNESTHQPPPLPQDTSVSLLSISSRCHPDTIISQRQTPRTSTSILTNTVTHGCLFEPGRT
ncbi:hypothetical protein F2P81_010261 [Scophthalmus maximus]|uniref:Uncharacterized protein n=1 Tax=Scophthalmus maximus TaxID=52904 RepID=A0A6A4SV86_SCOMX|nr:hypothetical protein F2P81_010261 [Scophthalmus maximus]